MNEPTKVGSIGPNTLPTDRPKPARVHRPLVRTDIGNTAEGAGGASKRDLKTGKSGLSTGISLKKMVSGVL